jgi:NAD(P)-dependent dehydrogenase (short-subunit alcohol dehydrogenase family)
MPPARFEGRTAIVTGGTGGIGSEISRRLASKGANVVVTGRNQVRGEAVVQSILDSAGTGVMMAADVADDAAVAGYINGAELAVDGGVTARLPIPEMRPSPRI